jgi:hypothetical protein
MRTFIAEFERGRDEAARLLLRYTRAEQQANNAGAAAGRAGGQVAHADGDRRRLKARLGEAQLRNLVPGSDGQEVQAISRQLAAVEADRNRLRRQEEQHRAAESAARAEMEQVRRDVRALHERHTAAAQQAAEEIAGAVGAHLKNRNPFIRGFQSGGEAVRSGISSPFVEEYLRLLDETITKLSTASLVLGWIPVVGPVLKGVSIALGIVSFAGHVFRALNGDESWSGALAKGLEIGLTVVAPLALAKATKAGTLTSGMARAGGIRKVSNSATINALLGDFYDNPLGYFKQAARWGHAGGKWAGPAGTYIEKSIHVVPVVAIDPNDARAALKAQAWTATYIGIGGAQLYKEGRDFADSVTDIVDGGSLQGASVEKVAGGVRDLVEAFVSPQLSPVGAR